MTYHLTHFSSFSFKSFAYLFTNLPTEMSYKIKNGEILELLEQSYDDNPQFDLTSNEELRVVYIVLLNLIEVHYTKSLPINQTLQKFSKLLKIPTVKHCLDSMQQFQQDTKVFINFVLREELSIFLNDHFAKMINTENYQEINTAWHEYEICLQDPLFKKKHFSQVKNILKQINCTDSEKEALIIMLLEKYPFSNNNFFREQIQVLQNDSNIPDAIMYADYVNWFKLLDYSSYFGNLSTTPSNNFFASPQKETKDEGPFTKCKIL